RMDRDTTTGKDSHARILKGLESGETDILIGTQMIAKGHDFPGVTLVGVLSPDSTLNLPDYRSAERTYQLLTQVIGRAGRGNLPGRVVVQTLAPDHYAVQCAVCHASAEFYEKEMEFRRELSYPPFSHLVALHFSGNLEERVRKGAEEARRLLESLRRARRSRMEILGPAPSPLARIRGKFRWQLLLKSASRGEMHRLLACWKAEYGPPSGVRVNVDVDPVEML
ncbi:MAG TPA: primosomal protein N', partial [Verrucomicrobiae bacterium]|nr:primosomal protein N' [Verrucomicrobiae bacterium]